MMPCKPLSLALLLLVSLPLAGFGEEADNGAITIESEMIHIRQADPREWAEFPEEPAARQFERTFQAAQNTAEWTLRLRHENVKQGWDVTLNGQRLGQLHRDENSMVVLLAVAAGRVKEGENVLTIATSSGTPDDVRIGDVTLIPQSRTDYLGTTQVEVVCREESADGDLMPCRITVLDHAGSLHDVGAESRPPLAVRTGVVFSAAGQAQFGLPPGKYRVIASRGPEYTIAQSEIELAEGDTLSLPMALRRVVDTTGWVAADTHVHTLTHSGHGDAQIEEQLIAICGEGIELPVAADHNKQIDYTPLQKSLGLSAHFTPIVGNEVTTPRGHFNIFPVEAGGPVPEHRHETWSETFEAIRGTADPEVMILNHARDLHAGFRPHGIENRHPLTGRQFDGWKMEANAMEVVNSGAQQSDIMQLPLDWMINLNRGLKMTPVGSSDSHDVARHFVGQGRTYIRADDSDPGNIDIPQAVRSFREGRVIVSCGLFPKIWIDEDHQPGDLVPATDDHTVKAKVEIWSAPWAEVDRCLIFGNGELLWEQKIEADPEVPRYATEVTLQLPPHDVHLELVALGPGVTSLHWPIARPYQPTSTEWNPQNFGMTGAVWYDGNGDGRRNPAREIAQEIVRQADADPERVIALLAEVHRSVTLQAAELLHLEGHDLNSEEFRRLAAEGQAEVRQAFRDYWLAWRDSELARAAR